MAETYNYSVSDFTNELYPSILRDEIDRDSQVSKQIIYVLVEDTDVFISFQNGLSVDEQNRLDYLVSIHPQSLPPDDVGDGGVLANCAAALTAGIHPVFGNFSCWSSKAGLAAKEVFYGKIYLPQGEYSAMECVVDSGGSASRTVDMGVYADVNNSPSGPLLASTGPIATNGAEDTFFRKNLLSNLVVPVGGRYYWLAINSGSASLKFSSSLTFSRAWSTRFFRTADTASATLGTLPGTFEIPASAMLYLAIVEA